MDEFSLLGARVRIKGHRSLGNGALMGGWVLLVVADSEMARRQTTWLELADLT